MLLWTGITFAGMVLAALILSVVLDPMVVDETFSRSDQCETLRADSTVMEPQNTWSNLAYLLAGLLIFFRNVRSDRTFGMAFGVALVALAWFSGLYHAQPVNGFFQKLDVATIYWVLPILIAYSLYGTFVFKVNAPGWTKLSIWSVVGFL